MRIAIFSEVYWPMVSGVARTLHRTVEALERRGHHCRVYTATYGTPGPDLPDPRVHQSPSRPFSLSPQVQWATPDRVAIATDLARFGPDLVHLATEFPMGIAGLRAARAHRFPVIASAHTDYEQYAGRYRLAWAVPAGWSYLRWFYRQARLVLAPSAWYADRLRQRGVAHTAVWSRGVDPDRFAPSFRSRTYRERMGIPPDAPLVAYVGRLAPEKGIERLLHLWPTLARLHPRAHLVFTGDGQLAEDIARRQLPRVHLTGALTGVPLAEAYASADLFVMPSETETFGNVTLEAMASGVATVALAAGGVLDFGVHGENCWLVPPVAPTGLLTAVDRLLADSRLRDRLATGARRTALDRGWDPVFDALERHYSAALDAAPNRRLAA